MEPDVILLNIVFNSNVGDGGAEPHFAIASSRSPIACWTIPATSCALTRLFLSSAFSCCSKMFYRRKELRSEHCVKPLLYNKNMCICFTHNDCLNKKTKNLISQLLCCSQIPTAITRAVNKSLIQFLTHRNQQGDQISAIGLRDLHKNVTVGLFQHWRCQRDRMGWAAIFGCKVKHLLLIYLGYKLYKFAQAYEALITIIEWPLGQTWVGHDALTH